MKPLSARRLTLLCAAFITIVLLLLLFSRIDYGDIVAVFGRLVPASLAAGFVFYLATQVLRAYRFHLLLDREVSTRDLFPVVCIYAMLLNLLPARTGELSYVYFLKTEFGRSTGEGLATLLIARILDAVILAGSFILLCLVVREMPLVFPAIMGIALFFITLLIIVLLLLLFSGRRCLDALGKAAAYFHLSTLWPVDYLLEKGEETVCSIEKFRTAGRGLTSLVQLISLSICITTYCFYLLLATGIGIPLDPVQILVASGFALFTFMIPVQGIGGFGTTEGGWAVGLIALGVAGDIAISSGFAFHLVNLFCALVLGMFGYAALTISRKFRRAGTDV